MADWLLYEHDDGRHAVAPSAEAATFAHGDPAWHRVGPVEVPAANGAEHDLDPRTALTYAKRMKDYCDAFNGRDWANVMIHGSPDEQNLAHALDNLTECAAMLMNMASRVAVASGVGACGSHECKAAQRDGVLCADGECDRVNGVRPDGVPGTPPTEQKGGA